MIKNCMIVMLCIFLTGCGPQWRKKFVRKKTAEKPEQVFIYEPKEYKRDPNDVFYKRHYIFWKAWHEELVNKLGLNKKSDLRAFEESLKHLTQMKICLIDEMAEELQAHIDKLDGHYRKYKTSNLDLNRARRVRQELDRLMLRINRSFSNKKVKEYFK